MNSNPSHLNKKEEGAWVSFTPTWVGPRFHWWQVLAKRRHRRYMESMSQSKYKQVGKVIHLDSKENRYIREYLNRFYRRLEDNLSMRFQVGDPRIGFDGQIFYKRKAQS